jgi:cysteinyl-tRNA synthetase
MEAGARVEVDARKKSPHDFALWKKAKEGEPSWESPWGPGRPGWHIECSVMSVKYLGQPFDIHGGGRDLIFPHHENEIAQAEAATGRLFARYWVHNGFVNVNKQKMSKSLGNFFTLQDIFKQYAPMVVRLFLLSTHYRSPINYSDQELTAAREAYERIVKFIANLDFLLSQTQEHAPEVEERDLEEELLPYKQGFTAAMEDDFNTAGALAALFSLLHFCNKVLAEGEAEKECLESMKKNVLALCDVLGIVVASSSSALSTESDEEEIKRLVVEREDARKKKDFASADKIRHQLSSLGILLEDTPYGTKWTKK